MKKVLLACAGGMSSAIAAKSLQDAAQAAGKEVEVHETSSQAFEEEITKDYVLALVAPQIRHRFDHLKELADQNNVPILLVAPKGYTPIGGKFLLKQITDELGDILD